MSIIDHVWVLVSGILVFFMQAGFMALEAGLVRSKNSINVAIKNFVDFIISSLTFWMFGFAIMFGITYQGLFGTDGFLLNPSYSKINYTFWFFQLVFAGTAATIVSGAIAERTKFKAYMIISVFVSGLIYPVFGHWAWGNLLHTTQHGWLSQMGFVDFAGSTVVHSIGGWTGLIGAMVIGPRMGKFKEDGSPNQIASHNLNFATLGTFILWLGWFGFNGGSTGKADLSVGSIITNTNLSAAAGGLTALLFVWARVGKPIIFSALNGVLAGLVSITANANFVSPLSAVIIGGIGGILVELSALFIERVLKVDDPVGAVAVHGVCGAWGTLAVALFIPAKQLPAGNLFDQLFIQGLGILSAFAWSMVVGYIIFKSIKVIMGIRPTPEEEQAGLNFIEHGARNVLSDTANTMNRIATTKDLTARIDAHAGDETGEIGTRFNLFLDWLHDVVFRFKNFSLDLFQNSQNLFDRLKKAEELIDTMVESMEDVDNSISKHEHAIGSTSTRLENMIHIILNLTNNLENQISHVIQSATQIEQLNTSIKDVATLSEHASKIAGNLVFKAEEGAVDIRSELKAIKDIEQSSHQIADIVKIIDNISTKTNLLAMNAAIEAAHAGDAGKGFAVVSTEIRKLSQNTSSSAKTISDILNTVLDKINNASQTAGRTEETLNIILMQIKETSLISNQIAHATQEQLQSSEEVLKSVESINYIINNIRNALKEQREDGENIALSITELVSITKSIKQSVTKQVSNSYILHKTATEVQKMSEQDIFIANNLNEWTKQFKLLEGSA